MASIFLDYTNDYYVKSDFYNAIYDQDAFTAYLLRRDHKSLVFSNNPELISKPKEVLKLHGYDQQKIERTISYF